jgi:hypothetical protein
VLRVLKLKGTICCGGEPVLNPPGTFFRPVAEKIEQWSIRKLRVENRCGADAPYELFADKRSTAVYCSTFNSQAAEAASAEWSPFNVFPRLKGFMPVPVIAVPVIAVIAEICRRISPASVSKAVVRKAVGKPVPLITAAYVQPVLGWASPPYLSLGQK